MSTLKGRKTNSNIPLNKIIKSSCRITSHGSRQNKYPFQKLTPFPTILSFVELVPGISSFMYSCDATFHIVETCWVIQIKCSV